MNIERPVRHAEHRTVERGRCPTRRSASAVRCPMCILLCSLVWATLAVSAAAGERVSPLPSMNWGFEYDIEGWLSKNCDLGRSDLQAREGGWSLCAALSLPKSATIYRYFNTGRRRPGLVEYSIYLPEEAPDSVRTLLFFKDKDGLWFQKVESEPLKREQWNRITVDVSPRSTELSPSGHFARWDGVAQANMNIIGIKLFSPEEYNGFVYLDAFFGYPIEEAEEPLRLYNYAENASEVKLYDKFEVSFNINRDLFNPFDPDEVKVDGYFIDPAGETCAIPGFYVQDFLRTKRGESEELIPVGGGLWKIRFAPTKLGTYTYYITVVYRSPSGKIADFVSERKSFNAIESPNRGFIRVSQKDPAYFEFDNGEFFYPIGHNIHSPTDDTPRNVNLLRKGVPPDRGTFAYEDFFDKMAKNGENMAEVWMCSWWLGLEWNAEWKHYWGLNRYNLHNAWKLDRLLEIAEKNDIYLSLVVDNHGKVSTWCDAEWENSPYNDLNGGFLKTPEEFFASRVGKELYKKLYRYIIARWAYSPRVMGWELWSELDLVGDSYNFIHHPSELAWHREITDFIRDTDPFDHLLTTHYSTNYSRINPAMISLPNISYAAVDAYKSSGSVLPLIQQTWAFMVNNGIRKPIMITEYGGSPWGTTHPGMRADLHTGIWAAYMNPIAGTPLLWWFLFIDEHDLYSEFKALANFARGEDRRGRNFAPGTAKVFFKDLSMPGLVEALCLQNNTQAYVWVYHVPTTLALPALEDALTLRGIAIAVGNLSEGEYTVEVWDTYKGTIVETRNATARAGIVSVDLPPFRCDTAIKIKHK